MSEAFRESAEKIARTGAAMVDFLLGGIHDLGAVAESAMWSVIRPGWRRGA